MSEVSSEDPSQDSSEVRPAPRRRTRAAGVILTAGLALLADLLSKSAAFEHHRTVQGVFGVNQPLELFDLGIVSLSLVREYNTGMAFGLLPGAFYLLVTVRLLFLAWMVRILRSSAVSTLAQRISLGILIAGALGNLSDNLLTFESSHPNAVRDFILVAGRNWSFPAFNLADTWITVGGLWFLWTLHRGRRSTDAPS